MSKPVVYTRGAYLGLHVGGCRLVYLVRGGQTHAWNPVVYTRYMQGWFFQAGVYLVQASDATCGRRTPPPEGRAQPNVIPSLDQNAMQCSQV